jgi:hypothetical protein
LSNWPATKARRVLKALDEDVSLVGRLVVPPIPLPRRNGSPAKISRHGGRTASGHHLHSANSRSPSDAVILRSNSAGPRLRPFVGLPGAVTRTLFAAKPFRRARKRSTIGRSEISA